MDNKIVVLKNVNKEYSGVQVVDNINLYVKKGEFVTILGPSGCGKTTTLRMIAGFETVSSGEIELSTAIRSVSIHMTLQYLKKIFIVLIAT